MRIFFAVAIAALLLGITGCKSKDEARVEGVFHGANGELVMIEKLSPHGSTIIDTLRTNKDGEFEFAVKFIDKNPVFVNVNMGGSFVPLLLSAGEDVSISAVGNIYNNYKVEGSDGSSKLRALSENTIALTRSLDSIMTLYEAATDPARVSALGAEYGNQYVQLKRSVIRFVVTNPTSLAAIVPLYQPLISGRFIFDEPSDIVYFRAVADSLVKVYPTSPYVISLRADLSRADAAFAVDSMLSEGMSEIASGSLPQITLKDAEGQLRSLSSLLGKVVLLDFTSLENAELKARNREMMPIYAKYAPSGFEIFQVSADMNKSEWLSAVVDARLHWISVCDFGTDAAFRAYNVTQVPSNFLIDRKGSIIGKNILPENLEQAVMQAL